MSYTPTVWQDGDLITAEKLNKIEQGIAALYESGGGPAITLPDGYKRLKYIQNNYYTSIPSEISVTTDTTRIVMDFEPIELYTPYRQYLVYAYNGVLSHPSIVVWSEEGTDEITFFSGLNFNYGDSNPGKKINSGYTMSPFSRATFDFDTLNKTLTINDLPIVVPESAIVGSGTSLGGNFCFGIGHVSSTPSKTYAVRAKIYSAQIYVNNDLFGDYVPCQDSSGIVGLYNIISGTFCTNTNTFNSSYCEPLAGPIVSL